MASPFFSSLLFCLCSGTVLSGCSSLGYLLQAGRGQLALSNRARPIHEVIREERTPQRLKVLLAEIDSIKGFGESRGLHATKNYTEFAQLDRSYAVWVVSACARLEFKSKEWNFPVVGSFPYLGWFDWERANSFKQELEKEGWDVDLRGARAFSTLGWFRDAVLSSMIPEGSEALGELVNVVLHESVHATAHFPGQAYFNESLASFVADRLTLEYLDEKRGLASQEKLAYLKAEEAAEGIRMKFHEAYDQLGRVYGSSKSEQEKLAEKAWLLGRLKEELSFKREINNATLVQHKTYHAEEGEFEASFNACGRNWSKWILALTQLKANVFSKPHQEDLKPVLDLAARSAGCASEPTRPGR